MRATGSRARRRCAKAAIAFSSVSAKTARARSREAGVIEPERVADQKPGVEFGRIDAAGAKFCGPGAPRFGDGDRYHAARGRNGSAGFRGRRHQFVSSAASSAA